MFLLLEVNGGSWDKQIYKQVERSIILGLHIQGVPGNVQNIEIILIGLYEEQYKQKK